MSQVWRHLTFLHWRYDPNTIASTLPRGLTLDTFDGSAWIGLVPFLLAGVRPYSFPALPWISEFPETNIRTYVRDAEGKRGVWFFTLEASRLAAVMLARTWYHLPYRWASMHLHSTSTLCEYQSVRSRLFGKGMTRISVVPGDLLKPSPLDQFLTARFRLYTAANGRIAYAQIAHDPWPLRSATIQQLDENLIENTNLPKPVGAPLIHYSDSLAVQAEGLQWIK